MYRSQNEVRKFYQRVKHQTEGFGTGTSSCKDKDGNLITDEDSVLRFWKEHVYQLSSVLYERLKSKVGKIIGQYQCGFRSGKSTIDQIFTLRQILEKIQEKQIDTYHIFFDCFGKPHTLKGISSHV